MAVTMRHRGFAILAASSLLLTAVAPASSGSRPGFSQVRLIDRLSPADFGKSPLSHILERFERADETFLQKDLTFIGADPKTHMMVFAYPLRRPALGVGAADPPAEASVRRGAQTMPYRAEAGVAAGTWSFLGRSQRRVPGGNLHIGVPWKGEVLVPKGGARLTFVLTNFQPEDYSPLVRLTVDGRVLVEKLVGERGRVSGELKAAQAGRHQVELRFDGGQNRTRVDERGAFLRHEELLVEGAADMVLLTLPQDAGLRPSQDYSLSYLVDPALEPDRLAKDPELADESFLYHTLNDGSQFLYDRGAAAGPGAPFRKIQWGGGAVNAILAQPPTKYSVTLDLAERSFLEFGYGLLRTPAGGKKGVISFEVALESSGGTFPLVNRKLRLGTKDRGTAYEPIRVDLSRFGGRKVRLTFSVTARDESPQRATVRGVPAFWANPVIFSPVSPGDDSLNVILVSLDTVRADHLGCYGYGAATSPNLDKLAADGVRFERASSASSWTLPSHMTLMTSLTLAHHGVLHEDWNADPSIITLADLLREKGYATGAFTAGGYVGSRFGFAKGFDFYIEAGMATEQPRAAAFLSNKASAWLGRNADKKFFLFLHTYQPHDPYSSPAPWGQALLPPGARFTAIDFRDFLGPHGDYRRLSDADRANVVGLYDGDIRFTDEAFIGPLVKRLRDLGLYDRTLIVVTSDHGEEFFDHGSWLHGRTLYEEQLHVPLIIKRPGSRSRGLTVPDRVQAPDVLPTILDELRIPFPGGRLDGQSLVPLLKGRALAAREILIELYGRDEFPLPLKGADPCLKMAVLVNGPFKLIYNVNDNLLFHFFSPTPPVHPTIEAELYDLDKDPGEKRNLAAERPDIVRRLLARLEAYYAALPPKARRSVNRTRLDPKLTEQLKAFGYIR